MPRERWINRGKNTWSTGEKEDRTVLIIQKGKSIKPEQWVTYLYPPVGDAMIKGISKTEVEAREKAKKFMGLKEMV